MLRSARSYDADVVSYHTGLSFAESVDRAQQHFRDECDINVMVARFQRTGVPDAPPQPPVPADFDKVFDFQSAMQTLIDARASFAALPAKVRSRFSNDPAQFLDFFNDPSNRAEAERLGFVSPVEVPSVSPVSAPVAEPVSDDSSMS